MPHLPVCFQDFAGQFVVFQNTERLRNFFRQVSIGAGYRHRFDEREFPAAVHKIGKNISVGHVFAQVTDQFGLIRGVFEWSQGSLVKRGFAPESQCYEYEVAIVHMVR